MFCRNCGKPILENAKFCVACGTPVAEIPTTNTTPNIATQQVQVAPQQAPVQVTIQSAPVQAVPQAAPVTAQPAASLIGYSKNANHPEILEAIKKQKAAGKGCLIPTMIIGAIAITLLLHFHEGQPLEKAAMGGGGFALVTLILYFYSCFQTRRGASYEATVVDKQHETEYKYVGNNRQREWYYVTSVRTASGKLKKYHERDGVVTPYAYSYLVVGERFYYHADMMFPYEKYDKSHETQLYCCMCRHLNPIQNDRCEKCGLPMLK